MKQSKSGALSASMTSSDSGVSGLQSAASAQAPPLDAVDAHSSMPADGPVLSHNLGIPVLVVVTKVRARAPRTGTGTGASASARTARSYP